MRSFFAQGMAALLLVAGSGAAQKPASSGLGHAPSQQAATSAPEKSTKARPYEVGVASWYGKDFDGKTTANGETFNMFDLTAAHELLPLGSYVRVTNLRNKKSVVVRINDRGPVVDGRIIDLSYSAARALQFGQKGLQKVRLDVLNSQEIAQVQSAPSRDLAN